MELLSVFLVITSIKLVCAGGFISFKKEEIERKLLEILPPKSRPGKYLAKRQVRLESAKKALDARDAENLQRKNIAPHDASLATNVKETCLVQASVDSPVSVIKCEETSTFQQASSLYLRKVWSTNPLPNHTI